MTMAHLACDILIQLPASRNQKSWALCPTVKLFSSDYPILNIHALKKVVIYLLTARIVDRCYVIMQSESWNHIFYKE